VGVTNLQFCTVGEHLHYCSESFSSFMMFDSLNFKPCFWKSTAFLGVVTSAPGKVLMTGGYLILERPNSGLVLSTNARFYAIIKPLHHQIKSDSWAWVWYTSSSLFALLLLSFTYFSFFYFHPGMDRYQVNLSSAFQRSSLQTRAQKSCHPNCFLKARFPFQINCFTVSKQCRNCMFGRFITVLFVVCQCLM